TADRLISSRVRENPFYPLTSTEARSSGSPPIRAAPDGRPRPVAVWNRPGDELRDRGTARPAPGARVTPQGQTRDRLAGLSARLLGATRHWPEPPRTAGRAWPCPRVCFRRALTSSRCESILDADIWICRSICPRLDRHMCLGLASRVRPGSRTW